MASSYQKRLPLCCSLVQADAPLLLTRPLKQGLAFEGCGLPPLLHHSVSFKRRLGSPFNPLEHAMVHPKKRPSYPEGEDVHPIREPEPLDSELGDDIDLDDDTDFIEPDIPLDEESGRVINPE